MKKLGIYIVATASCFFSSCLDTELYTTIPVDVFFKTEADAQAYLNGVYGDFEIGVPVVTFLLESTPIRC